MRSELMLRATEAATPAGELLSFAFQKAVARMVTNAFTARRVLRGELDYAAIEPALSPADASALGALLLEQGDRIVMVAEMLSSRRREKLGKLLPLAKQALDARFAAHWEEYLSCCQGEPVATPPQEAVRYAACLLRHLPAGSLQAELVKYDACRCEVGSRLHEGRPPAVDAATERVAEPHMVKLSAFVIIEEFAHPVDEIVRRWTSSGKVEELPHAAGENAPVTLAFHPIDGARSKVGAMRIAAAAARMLQRLREPVAFKKLLEVVPEPACAATRQMLQQLVTARILEQVSQ